MGCVQSTGVSQSVREIGRESLRLTAISELLTDTSVKCLASVIGRGMPAGMSKA